MYKIVNAKGEEIFTLFQELSQDLKSSFLTFFF